MSNRRLTLNLSNKNHRRLSNRARIVIAATLLSGGVLLPGMMAWANGPTPGTVIENQATGSFVDPSDNSTQLIESNVVRVTVAEVAGITVTENGYNEPTDGTVNEGDTVFFDFVITNVGNDPTQFFIPGAATISGGTANGNIQVIEYDPDGSGTSVTNLSGSNITVPSSGDNTGDLSGIPNNGSIPNGGNITVRVPVTAGTAGFDLEVTLGDTTATDGQNEAYVAGTNDVYTQDNTGTTNGDTDGAPINGEREASDSLTVAIAAIQNPLDPELCPVTTYLIQKRPSQLSIYNLSNGQFGSFTTISGLDNTLLNAVGFNSLDGFMYGLEDDATLSETNGDLYRLDQSGNAVKIGNIPDLINNQYNAGDVDDNGYHYVSRNGLNTVEIIDVDQTRATYGTKVGTVTLPAGYTIGPDLAYSPLDERFYTIQYGGGNPILSFEIDVANQTISNFTDHGRTTNIATGSAFNITAGATYFDNSGNFYAYNNDNGDLWRFETNPTLSTAGQFLGNGGTAPLNDGARCALAPVSSLGIDYGDAPDTGSSTSSGNYETLVTDNGPYHLIANGLHLGSSVTADEDGFGNGTDANGNATDDSDDDGVQLGGSDLQGQSLTAGNSITLDVTTQGAGVLNAWIDWNGDGDFEGTDEQIAINVSPTADAVSLNVNVPAGATLGNTYARFRYSSDRDLDPMGYASDGEVEDYQVEIAAPIFNISGTVYDDDNLNNTFDPSEPKMPEDITVRLLSSDGSVEIATTTTDANGDYSFSDIAPGTYQIQLETTDPDITVGYSLGTPNPLTVTVSSSDLTNNNFGFDNPRAGTGFSPFCVNTYGEVYVGEASSGNNIYAIQGDSGAVTTLTNAALALPNSLATDYLYRVVYYADVTGIYAWDAINDFHQRLSDINGNTNATTMPGNPGFSSLSGGGGAFYDGSLYLGVDAGPGGGGIFEIYRVDFAPGSEGKTIQSITALGINGPSAANGTLSDGDWGDFIIGDNGVIYGASGGNAEFWSYDLDTGTYTDLVDPVGTFADGVQLAKDGQGRLFGLPNTTSGTASTIIQLQIVGNAVQTVGSSSSISPVQGADAAECVIGRSAIGDRVWDDLDGDGTQDPLEPGIANVTVGLYRDIDADGVLDAGDPLLAKQLTNSNGNYDFIDLIFGNYIIKVLEGTPEDLDNTNLVDGAVITTANSPGGEDPVTLPTGIVDINDADFGYQLPIVPKDPNVLLVKRITQINGSTDSAGGDNLSSYIDQSEAINPYDDNDITVAVPIDPTDPPKDTDQWPTPLTTTLVGGIDGGDVMPNDEIEYTIYYLSSGDATAENVLFCDYVPTFTSFIPNAYTGSTPQATGGIGGADLSIELFRNGTTDYHTGANDGDSATYFSPGTDPASSFPGIDCDGDSDGINANPNGAVVVNLGDLPDATSDATGAYGYVRFRARVK